MLENILSPLKIGDKSKAPDIPTPAEHEGYLAPVLPLSPPPPAPAPKPGKMFTGGW